MLTQMAHRFPVLIKSLVDRKLDAVETLIQDHIRVEGLFFQYRLMSRLAERIPSQKDVFHLRREYLAGRIRKELEKHASAEEAVLYPACEDHEETRPWAFESYEEHKQIKTLIRELRALSVESEVFEAKMTVLMEDVTHHVHEEEESFFPMIRKVFSHPQLMKMGRQIRNHKKTARRQAAAA